MVSPFRLKHHPDLSKRKGEQLSTKRLKGADPFVVYKFYQQLESLYDESGFNCDESGFCHNPKDTSVVAEKRMKRVSLNIAGSGRNATSALARGSASW